MMKKVEGFATVNTSTLFISSVLSSIHIPIGGSTYTAKRSEARAFVRDNR